MTDIAVIRAAEVTKSCQHLALRKGNSVRGGALSPMRVRSFCTGLVSWCEGSALMQPLLLQVDK